MAGKFPDPLGVGSTTSLALAVFAEVVCSVLLAFGLFTRLAAAVLAINMATAFLMVHKLALTGPGSGELASRLSRRLDHAARRRGWPLLVGRQV